MRVSRPCYDKYHRCPGWAGGGMKRAKRYRCDGGTLAWEGSKWRIHRCSTCDVIVLPYVIRWIDPAWYRHWFRYLR